MKGKVFCLFAAFSVLFSLVTVPPAKAESLLDIYNSFTDSVGVYETGGLPDGITVCADYRRDKLGTRIFDEARYGEAMSIGYLGEPVVPFGKLVNSDKLHISMDIMVTDVNARRALIGLYDGRNNTDPESFGLNEYSKMFMLECGKVYYSQVDANKASVGDMACWTWHDSGITYTADTWYTLDFEFDFNTNTADYYFNGVKANTAKIGTGASNGFKSLFLRCELPRTALVDNGTISSEQYEAYKTTSDAFVIDNVSVNEYTTQYSIGNVTDTMVNPMSGEVYVSTSDYIDSISAYSLSVTDDSGASAAFKISAADSRGFLLSFDNLRYSRTYTVNMSGITGNKFGAVGKSALVFETKSQNGNLFYDNFDDYSDASFAARWKSSLDGKAELVEISDTGKAARLVSAESGTKSGITHDLFEGVNEDKYTVEMVIKATGGFDVCFIDDMGAINNVIAVNSNSTMGYYPNGSGRSTALNDLKLRSMDKRYNKIKLAVDKTSKSYTISAGGKSYKVQYNFELGDLYGISITMRNAWSAELFLDEVRIHNKTSSEIYADFTSGESDGALFFSEGDSGRSGLVLKCAEKSSNGYYTINRANGTMTVDIDGDTSLVCGDYNNVKLDITYTDSGYGWFYVVYNSAEDVATTETVCLENTGEERTKSLIISNMDLNGDNADFGFEIRTYTIGIDGSISASDRRYSKYSVLIKSISVSNTGKTSAVGVDVTSDNTGNIFYEDELPRFTVRFENRLTEAVNANASIIAYRYDKNMTPQMITGKRLGVSLAAGEVSEVKTAIPVDDFGLYMLKVGVTSSAIEVSEEVPFSYCVRNTELNPTMGAAAHFTRYGDADSGLELMKNAGMGLVRDDYTWNEYERTKGVYALTERQEKLCDASVKYGIKLLPIVYGNNTLYDSTGSAFVSDAAMPDFLRFVENILSEEKMMAATDMVELWNEPDLASSRNGTYIGKYVDRGEIYGDILKQSAQKIRSINHPYKIGAVCLSNLISTDGKSFADAAFSKLTDGDYFDAIALHPYISPGVDPEKGRCGEDTTDPTDYVGYRTNYFRALANGSTLYNHTTGEDETISGLYTGNTYNFNINEPMWHTEYGISTAIYDKDSLCVGSEWAQAMWLMRGFNQIKLNSFDDKVWFYDFADDGDRINEKEHNFGILHSYTGKVPYAAKYSYLAISCFNKLTEGAVSAQELAAEDYKFISKYHSENRDVYILWTSKTSAQTLNFDLGADVKYYDMLGNELSEAEVMQDGSYVLTETPFYAVSGEQPSLCGGSADGETGLYFDFGGIGIGGEQSSAVNSTSFAVLADMSGIADGTEYTLYCAAYKDEGLTEIKTVSDVRSSADGALVKFNGLGFETRDIDSIKIILTNSRIAPLCSAAISRGVY